VLDGATAPASCIYQDTVAMVAGAATTRPADRVDATALTVAKAEAEAEAAADLGLFPGSAAAVGAPSLSSPLQQPATERPGWRRRRTA
jgi:hypothetical protein